MQEGSLYRKHPFLSFDWKGGRLRVLNPETGTRSFLHPKMMDFLGKLDSWKNIEEISSHAPVAADKTVLLLEKLLSSDVIEQKDISNERAVDSNFWSPIEMGLLTQSESVKFVHGDSSVEGEAPSARLEEETKVDVTLTPSSLPDTVSLNSALNSRRSSRCYSEQAVSMEELSAVLFNSYRVMESFRAGSLGIVTKRPTPSGGARHPLEIYPYVNRVEGLKRGLYHYNAWEHGMNFLKAPDEYEERIWEWLNLATVPGMNRPPAVVLFITARFARTLWKYRSVGLNIVLKDVGALYQSLYLSSTALGLAATGIGPGNEKQNSSWLGVSLPSEYQVGAFIFAKPGDES